MATISSRDRHLVEPASFDLLWERFVAAMRAAGALDEDTIAYAKLDDVRQALLQASVIPKGAR
ncbi:hypothetical protein [Methylibium petroleiphilum]|uniref:Uncharacterized protein n=1 Tax=Methylibium petroleiphilum (strain ATCC BAA-1232 / LMG 22953 / PM1) TaxID=420662 RepID=A2SN74_METPP|nr:hypothetical protein [Methylibium petroleiphilum]ABM97013.1 hypothetical protein Mpe_B0238 [Methylibium petroleiphilum PM1]